MTRPSQITKGQRLPAWPLVFTLLLSLLWIGGAIPLAAQDDEDLTSLYSEGPEEPAAGQAAPTPSAAPALPPLPPAPTLTETPPPPPASASTLPGALPGPPAPQAPAPQAPAPQAASSPYELATPAAQTMGELSETSDEGVLDDPFPDPPAATQGPGPMDAELAMPPLAPGDGTAPAQGETARTPELTLPSPPEEPDYSAFQGQVVTPPPPPWQRASRETSGLPSASGPLPDFDASQGRWQQMEIGQFDRPRNAPPVGSGPGADGAQGLFPADTGASAQTAQVSSPGQAAPGDQATPAAQSNQGGDPFVRELFSEYLTETLESNPPQNEPEPAQPAQQTQQAQPAQRAQAEPPAPTSAGGPLPPPGQGGGSLGELFSEFTTTDVPDNSPRPPEAPSGSGSVIIPISPPPQPGSLTAPLAPPPLPPTALAPPDDPAALPDPGEDAANLAIARAGSLLMEEGMRPRVGSAAILEPGDPAAKANGKQAPSKTAKKNERPAGKANAKANGKAAPKANAGTKKAARPRAAAPARPNLSVMVVNETGRPQVGEDYRLVLSRMGYKVVSVTERSPSGQGGGTVIAYRSGRQSQARALARRLPGPRQLEPSREALPAEAVVVIR